MQIRTIATCASLLLAGCQPQTVDTSCLAFKPITFSAKWDTPQTVAEVREHNASFAALCSR